MDFLLPSDGSGFGPHPSTSHGVGEGVGLARGWWEKTPPYAWSDSGVPAELCPQGRAWTQRLPKHLAFYRAREGNWLCLETPAAR